jgi:hypothetical protein
MVRKRGLEPLQDCSHKALNLARLPVPPLPLQGNRHDSVSRWGPGPGLRSLRRLLIRRSRRRRTRSLTARSAGGLWRRLHGVRASRSQRRLGLRARHFQGLRGDRWRRAARLFRDTAQHASRRGRVAGHERQEERAHHERNTEHGGCFAEKRGRATSTEQALGGASGHAECTGQAASLSGLQQHDQDQEHANDKMYAQDQRVDQRTLPRDKGPDC